MKLGYVIDVKSDFIKDLIADWEQHFDTESFGYRPIRLPVAEGRVNGWRRKRQMARFLAEKDVVFFEWVGPSLILASQLPKSARIIARLHSYELYEYAPHVQWDTVDRIIFVSRAMERRFAALYPDQAAKTQVVYNGVALDKFRPAQRSFSGAIGMLGIVTPIKRFYEMVLSLHTLRQNGYDVHLHIAGAPRAESELDQRYFASIQSAIVKLGLEQHVTLHGYVHEPASWLQQIDIFISNSFWEGIQTALVEAMASGCYCLAHFWDGAEEVLPPEHLYGPEPELIEKLARYMDLAARQKQEIQGLMRAIACEKFDVERQKRELRQAIQEVAGSAR